MDNQKSRRNFVKKMTLGATAALCIPDIVSAAFAQTERKPLRLHPDSIVLFQGDSITDWRRKKTDLSANSAPALGLGYVFSAATQLMYSYPQYHLQVFNRGVSGNKVYQLADRWDVDCLDLKPDVLSILVGVNDFWHTLVNGYKGTVDTYRHDYDALLERTLQKLPEVKLIIGEPYAIRGVKAVDDKWFPKFDEYRAVAKEIAEKYKAVFIPYQSVYDKAIELAPGNYWTLDGVHPSIAGAGLMAHAWLETVKR